MSSVQKKEKPPGCVNASGMIYGKGLLSGPSKRHRRRVRSLLAFAVAVSATAGCGGGSSPGDRDPAGGEALSVTRLEGGAATGYLLASRDFSASEVRLRPPPDRVFTDADTWDRYRAANPDALLPAVDFARQRIAVAYGYYACPRGFTVSRVVYSAERGTTRVVVSATETPLGPGQACNAAIIPGADLVFFPARPGAVEVTRQ